MEWIGFQRQPLAKSEEKMNLNETLIHHGNLNTGAKYSLGKVM